MMLDRLFAAGRQRARKFTPEPKFDLRKDKPAIEKQIAAMA